MILGLKKGLKIINGFYHHRTKQMKSSQSTELVVNLTIKQISIVSYDRKIVSDVKIIPDASF